MKKIIPIILILLLTACVKNYTEIDSSEYTEWMGGEEYQLYFDSQLKKHYYPVEVEGKTDGKSNYFRAIFKKIPRGPYFMFRSTHGCITEEFEEINSNTLLQGYKKIWHQEFESTYGDRLHQATWVKR
ncbi:hypothetical protein [Maridesulfovibrio sp. FT414]|uniref:hypothetical protein n=1 Tax=Maridesulfovibrio sp. FT414 TaxID=2979469 RepID=UPI003D802ECF